MRTEIKALHQRLTTTTVYVTHDQIEAMTMADKIVVMHDGIVEQVGRPLELYDRPVNRFVAGFIGSPALNFLPGRVNGAGIALDGAGYSVPVAAALQPEREVTVGIRPEHLEIAPDGFEAEVVVVEPTGSETQLFARVGAHEIAAVFRERHEFSPGQRIRLRPRPGTLHVFDHASGQRI
jgi:multiple sugar transport system ATP-binding protein